MDRIFSSSEIQKLTLQLKKKQTIGLVPTMGCLHDGHLSLIKIAKEQCDVVILTIFVNPLQFGPNEDLDAYPRQFEADCLLAEKAGVDLVFAPDNGDMYDESFQTSVNVETLSQGLCGADRPGHFAGVTTVVSKLFNLTHPDIAVFGRKDFQQLAVIKQLVKDLNFPVKIVGAPIVREPDGLAMSSRNKYLQGKSRVQALCLSQAIEIARKTVESCDSACDAAAVIEQVKAYIEAAGAELEYAVIVDECSLINENVVSQASVLAVAAKIDHTVRLIDNAKLMAPE